MLNPINENRTDGTYIFFYNLGPWRKQITDRYEVLTKTVNAIGQVRWFGSWRKYCFFPYEETVYEEVCLREIAEFCEKVTKEHKAKKKEVRG